ncbi:MAG TPA: GIY-YIG nuclease family protein [Bacteroidia bacterium]|jgi:putative endonuclease|nr:GIY-YIG nuclease family protein [Bacteroidia bacterium]
MIWKIYILYSKIHKRTYVGCSQNIANRLKTHNEGKVTSTKRFIPWKVIYTEEAGTYADARKKEKYYKSSAGRRKMKAIFDELKLNK